MQKILKLARIFTFSFILVPLLVFIFDSASFFTFREELDEVSNRRLTSMAHDIVKGLAYLADLKYVHRYSKEYCNGSGIPD